MVDHMRKRIRDYLETQLTGLPTTGARVYAGRSRPLGAEHQPTLLIYMRSETSARTVMGRPPKQERPCTLFLEARVVTPDVPDDLLDGIAGELEERMGQLIEYEPRVVVFGGLAQNCELVGTEIIAEADGKNHIGAIRLEYRVTYRVTEGAPFDAT
ncbi:hypothetical protein [Bradyrhizobium sp. SZCCHNS3002]|uniref:hypothetical protein n=1 Tax=Bradyrhizobium sp. SZCCHNS3002 TaxID=3057310 RepID=UPI0028EFA3BB|nr:hypothetical protein [Bradyrhizobium sp. SZCCHNS3002]